MKKPVNFCEVIPPQESKRIAFWWHCSCLLFFIMVLMISVIQVRQLYTYKAVKKSLDAIKQQDTNYQQLQKKLADLQAEEKNVHEKLACWSKASGSSQKLMARCKAITVNNPEIIVQSFESTEQATQITVLAPSVEKVFQWMQSLNQSGSFTYLALTSLQQRDKAFLFTIKEGR
jgi:hypothetical protein